MHPKTEEFLYFLLWAMDRLGRPTFRNLTDSYESWAYRNGLLRQLRSLETQGLIEPSAEISGDRLYRLTEAGRRHALGGEDPEARWARAWDGRWRLVLYDVPVARNSHRQSLRRYLGDMKFGCLQGSVWVTPDPLHSEREILAGGKVNVGSLLLLEARPCAGESDAEIVTGAWNFTLINRLYREHEAVLGRHPVGPISDVASARALRRWATEEREAWGLVAARDPFLPERLWPDGYLGREAWGRRKEVLGVLGRWIEFFHG